MPPKKPSLTQAAYHDLRWRILSGEMPAGVLLTEAEVCEATGLGKAPVRAALAELRHDRLIDVLPRRGFIVRPWTARESAELLAARATLEPVVAAQAAAERTSRDLAAMDDILRRSRDAARDEDRRALVMIDHDYHLAIARASGNAVFADLVGALKSRSHHQFTMAISAPALIARVLREHDAIRAAIGAGDSDGAEAAMRAHLGALGTEG